MTKKQLGNSKTTLTRCLDNMVKVNSQERFVDFGARGKFGMAWEYGEKIYGQDRYGVEEIEPPAGSGLSGKRWGIYQKRKKLGEVFYVKMHFYIPTNPNSTAQQTQRNKFKDGMTAWKDLTDEEKESYNKKGSKLGLPAQNVFLKEYLNSH